jgi:SAM-dependent methyltransferase
MNASSQKNYSDSFYLDDQSLFDISNTPLELNFPRWMQVSYCLENRLALILVAGEALKIREQLMIQSDSRLFIRYTAGLPNISTDGLQCEIYFQEDGGIDDQNAIAILPLKGGIQSKSWRAIEFDISYLAGHYGHLLIKCDAGKNGDKTADWLAISDLCYAMEDQLQLVKARSFKHWRITNEISQFNHAYQHSMYELKGNQQMSNSIGPSRIVRKLVKFDENRANIGYEEIKVHDVEPFVNESVYAYATRLMGNLLPGKPPDFLKRLKLKSDQGNIIKVLSLCSGTARIEASFASQLSRNVEWTLLDINTQLLNSASKSFDLSVKCDLIEADINNLKFNGDKWDIILCISALHHVVELERLIKFCHESLNLDGEFWSIGECVGKNGNRLWSDAKIEADKIFQQLPIKYKKNLHTNNIDFELPDIDCSITSFEGIRSEEIEKNIDRWFYPLNTHRGNCFLWRIINQAYSDNYNINNSEDRLWIAKLVNAEINYFRSGGIGTELNGIYKPRKI